MTRTLRWQVALFTLLSISLAHASSDEQYLGWDRKQSAAIGLQTYKRGRVGGFWDTRGLDTDQPYNYKLAATWMTPETIRATARLAQLGSRLSDSATNALVAEAESVSGTVVIVEIDPREGSGVIPNDWEAFLQPKGRPEFAVAGTKDSSLRNVRGLAGVMERNYDYDRFWVVFPLKRSDNTPLFASSDQKAELVVRIKKKEGRKPVRQSCAIDKSRALRHQVGAGSDARVPTFRTLPRRGEVSSAPRRDAASALRQFENHTAGVPIRGGAVSTMAE